MKQELPLKFLLLLFLILFIPVVHAEQVKVGDISVKYNKIGKGDPVLIINGFGGTLEGWNPKLLNKLAENHTVITFSLRGVGNTTSGDQAFTMKQFALDTKLFLDKLNITKADVIGVSMGGMIAQELALYSSKVNKLIIVSSHCGQQLEPISKEVMKILNSKPSEVKQKLRELNYPKGFDFSTLPKSSEKVSDKTLEAQVKAIYNWKGICDKLYKVKQDTLVLTGKNDKLVSPNNSILMAKNIPHSTLIQIEGTHTITAMQPDKVADIILFFMRLT